MDFKEVKRMLNDMEKIKDTLQENIKLSLEKTDLNNIFKELNKIHGICICSGVGGSMIPAKFLRKILQKKNGAIVKSAELLEILQNKEQIEHVLLISHSGKNYGIKRVIETIPNTYLVTTRKTKIKNEILLQYQEYKKEKSFISILNTFLPMSIFLNYYLGTYPQYECFKITYHIKPWNMIEVFKDDTSECCASYIESVCIEANLGPVIIHDKYSFCHGRTTFTHYQSSLIVFLVSKKTKLDEMLLKILKEHKKELIILNAEEKDSIIADYKLCFMALNFLVQIAQEKKIDLCNIKYAPFASTLYHNKLEDYV